jgi:uncharacterized repeat protein (TIGR04076 family)
MGRPSVVMSDIHITVIKRTFIKEAADLCGPGFRGPCHILEDGQEWTVDGVSLAMPEGFCSWAWAAIHEYVVTLARGGNFSSSLPGKVVTCCTDGYRPVIFALERVEDEE